LTDHDLHERFEKKDVSHLKVLIAPFKSITDKSFDNLAYATHLKILDLSENQRITDRGIEKIQHLRHLEILRLSSTEITDASVPYIKQFTALKELNVLNTLLSKEGVDEIKKAIPALEAPGAFIYNPFLDMKE
jgi:Ran GTPase-activating protein (RanGAP) involved in mRNA processing and transport